MAWKDGFVIEYIPRRKRKRKRLDCRDCTHADLQHKACTKRAIDFWEYGSCYYGYYSTCKYFKTHKSLNGKKESQKTVEKNVTHNRSTGSLASKPQLQSSSGVRTKRVDRFSESKKMIQNASREHLFDDRRKLLEDIRNSNYIELWDIKEQSATCDCGGDLVYSQENEVYFHIKDEIVSIQVWGQYCKDCRKLFIVKDTVLNYIRNIEKGK